MVCAFQRIQIKNWVKKMVFEELNNKKMLSPPLPEHKKQHQLRSGHARNPDNKRNKFPMCLVWWLWRCYFFSGNFFAIYVCVLYFAILRFIYGLL